MGGRRSPRPTRSWSTSPARCRSIVEGARLAALAAGEPPPPAHEDPDIRAAVAEVIGDFTLEPGGPDADLEIAFRAADQAHAAAVANQLAARLQPRLRRLRLRLAD